MDLDIELGDNAKYRVVGVGIVAFRKGFDDLLEVTDVLHVSRLMKNLLLVSHMEVKGLTMTFDGG